MKSVKIGRSAENNNIALNKGSVSREHCTIIQDENGRCFLEDHSKNGTKVNGKTIHNTKVSLRFDSTIIVEGVKLPWLSYFKGDKLPEPQQPIEQPKDQEFVMIKEPTPIPIDIDTYDLSVNSETEYNIVKQTIVSLLNDYKDKLHAQKKTAYHSFSDELLLHTVESYNQKFAVLNDMLTKTGRNSVDIQQKYERNIQLLENLRIQKMLIAPMQSKKVDATDIYAIEQRKIAITKQFTELKSGVRSLLNEIVNNFSEKYPLLFQDQYETAATDSKFWDKFERRNSVSVSTLFIGKNNIEFPLFDEKFTVHKNEYLTFLNTQNIIIHHNTVTKQQCLDFVNTLAGRLLTASMPGKFSVSMIDAEEMDGTCDEFKRLNKSIFGIYAREEDICKHLEEIVRHIENIIQNVLHGDIRSLSDYNRGKEDINGYKLLIIKSFPSGIGGRAAQLLKKILKNGVRVGVNVILLFDEDEINHTEESKKLYAAFNIDVIQSGCAVYDFTNATQIQFENL